MFFYKCGAEAILAFELLLPSLCEMPHFPIVFVIVTKGSYGLLIMGLRQWEGASQNF